MKLKLQLGFTLIEILVVMAIIMLLASVIYAALNTARAKASDALVKTEVRSLHQQAQIFYNNNTTYGTGASGAGPSGQTTTYAKGTVVSYTSGCTTAFYLCDKTAVAILNVALQSEPVTLTLAQDGQSYAIAATLSDNSTYTLNSSGTTSSTGGQSATPDHIIAGPVIADDAGVMSAINSIIAGTAGYTPLPNEQRGSFHIGIAPGSTYSPQDCSVMNSYYFCDSNARSKVIQVVNYTYTLYYATGNDNSFAAAAPISSGQYWCADSKGSAKLEPSAPSFGASPYCP